MKNSKHEESTQQDRFSDSHQVSGERRRLTKAGLVAPVLMSFSSRPAWAATCTLSGMLSGNISGPFSECASALSADYWDDNREQWGGRNSENVNSFFGLGSFFTDSTTFESFYDDPFGAVYTGNGRESCANRRRFQRSLVLLIREAIAAVLNADNFGSAYPKGVSDIQSEVASAYSNFVDVPSGQCNNTTALDDLAAEYQDNNNLNPYP